MVSSPAHLAPIAEKFKDYIGEYQLELGETELSFSVPALGQIVLEQTEVIAPNMVKYGTKKSPIPLSVLLNLSKNTEETTLGQISVEVDVPPFLSGMVKKKIEPALDKVSNVLEQIDFDRLVKGTSLEGK